MPVIVFASPKGGVGKSTSAVVLACELAQRNAEVVIIDADPNHPVSAWSSRPGKPASLTVLATATEDSILDDIEVAARRTTFVIVDLEGTASMTVAYAISRADLVIIPVQGSQLDAAEAVRAVRLIRQQERAFRRTIPHAILFTRTSAAIKPRTLQHIRGELTTAGIPILQTQMFEREAFRAIFSFGGVVADLDPKQVTNLAAAQQNARGLAAEIVGLLRHPSPLATSPALQGTVA